MSVPRFLADEDLRFEIVLAVLRLVPAIQFVSVRDVGCSGASDLEILQFADVNGWIVVSHDLNTMRGLAEAQVRGGAGFSGLFLVPQSRPTRVVAECLVLVWSASQAEEWVNRIVYLPF